tara:strand:- start:2247 stop:2687 length:441 start_codon:yes stop_codon:yes gene_type:complete
MAYLIFENIEGNNLHRIAANEADKNSLHLSSTQTIKEISDNDFEDLIKNKKYVSNFDGANVTYDTIVVPDVGFSENDIKQHHKILIDVIENFLQNNALNAMATPLTNYKNYLSNFDYSSLTYPLNISWEEYCSINSITYYHCLQIP